MYETIPVQISGNIHNIDDPNETVLGLFYSSAVQEKIIFVRANFMTYDFYNCSPYGLTPGDLQISLNAYLESSYPVYLVTIVEGEKWDLANQSCFDCRLRGGNLYPPDYWE